MSFLHINYYEQHAKGGTGLIMVENASVDSPEGSNGTTQLRIDHDNYLPRLFKLQKPSTNMVLVLVSRSTNRATLLSSVAVLPDIQATFEDNNNVEIITIGDSVRARRIIEGTDEGRNILNTLEKLGYL